MFTLAVFVCFLLHIYVDSANPRHIVFIIADDLGWNDIGFHNPSMLTPNIDSLAKGGVILDHSYVQPLCSPSRSAIMSSYYPFKTGLQHFVITDPQAVCLPRNITILPQKLKELGYATHMVGKWHLGFCNWNCTPTYRGFDTFFGYYNAMEDYYTHKTAGFLDYRNNSAAVTDEDGEYSTYRFTKQAINIIKNHDKKTPLFLYLPFQAVHEPIEVPKKYENLYPNIKTDGRRKFCGMVSSLDEAVGNVTNALKEQGLFNDTLILFTADNGGWVSYYGNNWPLRGGKFTIYEGGTRAVAFMHGAGLQNPGTKYDGMIHVVDWLPTLMAAAGGTPVTDRDGVNQWPAISTGAAPPRNELVYNYDQKNPPEEGHAAIRIGDWKLVVGYPGLYPDWYKPDQEHKNKEVKYKPYMREPKELYNLKDDPTEHNDLSDKYPDKVKELSDRLDFYIKQAVEPMDPLPDPASNPKYFNNVWSPGWCK